MSIQSTNPATRIGDQDGRVATLDKKGVRTTLDVRDEDTRDLLKRVLEKLDELIEAVRELDNS